MYDAIPWSEFDFLQYRPFPPQKPRWRTSKSQKIGGLVQPQDVLCALEQHIINRSDPPSSGLSNARVRVWLLTKENETVNIITPRMVLWYMTTSDPPHAMLIVNTAAGALKIQLFFGNRKEA
jgi:hypothetical protein